MKLNFKLLSLVALTASLFSIKSTKVMEVEAANSMTIRFDASFWSQAGGDNGEGIYACYSWGEGFNENSIFEKVEGDVYEAKVRAGTNGALAVRLNKDKKSEYIINENGDLSFTTGDIWSHKWNQTENFIDLTKTNVLLNWSGSNGNGSVTTYDVDTYTTKANLRFDYQYSVNENGDVNVAENSITNVDLSFGNTYTPVSSLSFGNTEHGGVHKYGIEITHVKTGATKEYEVTPASNENGIRWGGYLSLTPKHFEEEFKARNYVEVPYVNWENKGTDADPNWLPFTYYFKIHFAARTASVKSLASEYVNRASELGLSDNQKAACSKLATITAA